MLGGFFKKGTQVIVRVGNSCIRKGTICSNQIRIKLEASSGTGVDVDPYQLHFYEGNWAAFVDGNSQLVAEILYYVAVNGTVELVRRECVEEF